MIGFSIKATVDEKNDGITRDLELDVWPGDIVKFEREYDVPIGRLAEDQRFEWLTFLAYSAARRADKWGGTFDTFVEALRDIDLTVEDAADPLERNQPPTG